VNRTPQNDDLRAAWFGRVSPDWKLGRAKNAFRVVSQKVGTRSSEYDLLSLTLKGIIPRDLDSGKGKFPESFDTYQEVKNGDIVFCLFDIDETPRTVGLSAVDGMITGAYTVVRCTKLAEPRYVTYFYLSIDQRKGLRPFYTGLRKVVRTETFLNAAFPLPDLATQHQIADFLDRETARIDLLIKKKQRLVALLGEKRQSGIVSAVTLGLNSAVDRQDNGVSWVPKIPKNWELKKIKYLGKPIIGLTYSPDDLVSEGEGTPVLRANNIQAGKLQPKNLVYVASDVPRKLRLRQGDILICSRNGSRNLIGKNAVVTSEFTGMTFGAFNTVLRSKYSDFLYWVLQSPVFDHQAGSFLTSTINQLTISTLSNLVVPFAPPDEQEAICRYLLEREKIFNASAKTLRTSIDCLKEYRSALITAAVTGQINVQTYAKSGTPDRRLDAIQEEMGA